MNCRACLANIYIYIYIILYIYIYAEERLSDEVMDIYFGEIWLAITLWRKQSHNNIISKLVVVKLIFVLIS